MRLRARRDASPAPGPFGGLPALPLRQVEFLLDRGAAIDALDAAQETALHHAARSGHKECVQMLLSKGADILARNQHGQTPYDAAKNLSIRQLLLPLQLKAEQERGVAPVLPGITTAKSLSVANGGVDPSQVCVPPPPIPGRAFSAPAGIGAGAPAAPGTVGVWSPPPAQLPPAPPSAQHSWSPPPKAPPGMAVGPAPVPPAPSGHPALRRPISADGFAGSRTIVLPSAGDGAGAAEYNQFSAFNNSQFGAGGVQGRYVSYNGFDTPASSAAVPHHASAAPLGASIGPALAAPTAPTAARLWTPGPPATHAAQLHTPPQQPPYGTANPGTLVPSPPGVVASTPLAALSPGTPMGATPALSRGLSGLGASPPVLQTTPYNPSTAGQHGGAMTPTAGEMEEISLSSESSSVM